MDNTHMLYLCTSVTEWDGQEMPQLDLVQLEVFTRIIISVAHQMPTTLHVQIQQAVEEITLFTNCVSIEHG
jgi:hypothetical protein